MRSGTFIESHLTIKQKAFVTEYLKNGLNGAQAILDAGYDTDRINAATAAYGQLKKPAVRAALDQELARLENELGITLDYKAQKLKTIVDRAIPDEPYFGAGEHYKTGISAIAELNKMQGHYAPNKNVNVNVNAEGSLEQLRDVMDGIAKQYEKEY